MNGKRLNQVKKDAQIHFHFTEKKNSRHFPSSPDVIQVTYLTQYDVVDAENEVNKKTSEQRRKNVPKTSNTSNEI